MGDATLSAEDQLAIAELVAMHGHLFDEGQLSRLDQLFTSDIYYDASDFGQVVMQGIDAIRSAALALGDRNPVAHLVTNVVISFDAGTVTVKSKGVGVTTDGKVGSVNYLDTVVSTPAGWRISRRVVHARRQPLNGLGSQHGSSQ